VYKTLTGLCAEQQVFEAINMSYLWKLPCVFVVENNKCARALVTASRFASQCA